MLSMSHQSHTHTGRELESKMGQRQETGDHILQLPLKKRAIKVLAAAQGLFPWPNFSKHSFVLRWFD